MAAMKFQRLLVCGVGLIGGSFALALKASGTVNEVVGLGRSWKSLQQARDLHIIDNIANSWEEVLPYSDLVLLSMPVGGMSEHFLQMASYLRDDTVICDAGSTKSDIVAIARQHLADKFSQFVPAHPIAGAEHSGAAAASVDLFQGKRVVITPLPETRLLAIGKIQSAWQDCGAIVNNMSHEEHDAVFAAVSHLPHMLAYILVNALGQRENSKLLFEYAASGFRDFTRIASSNPEMWRDITLSNREAILKELDDYMQNMLHFRVLIAGATNRAEFLEDYFNFARQRREQWLQEQEI